jgi:predicted transcriptional regulator of viral defense system
VRFVPFGRRLGPRATLCTSCVRFVTRRAGNGSGWDEMHPDERVVAIAGRRHGVISSSELARAGLSRRAVSHRVGRGWLHRMHRGVYLVGPLEAPLSRAAGAVLAIGDGAVLSHHSAAAAWELLAHRAGPIAVTLPARDARRRPGIELHRVRHLDSKDIRRHRAVLVTSPARTLLDLAATLPRRRGSASASARVTPFPQ